jgi:hypothetical protein
MTLKVTSMVLGTVALALASGAGLAGGRYANPPVGLVDTFDLCTKGLDAAQKGDKDAALDNAKKARKISLDSYKEISTMPMEIAAMSMKKALAAIDSGNVAGSIPEFEHCVGKLKTEIDFYKGEGKL